MTLWLMKLCAWEGILKAYQWTWEITEPHFAWTGHWQKQHETSASQTSIPCGSTWMPILTHWVWALCSDRLPGAAITVGPWRPHFEYQGCRQGAFGTLPPTLLQFSSSPKTHPNLPKPAPHFLPHFSPSSLFIHPLIPIRVPSAGRNITRESLVADS